MKVNEIAFLVVVIVSIAIAAGNPVTDGSKKTEKAGDDGGSLGGIDSFFSSYYSKTDRYDLASGLLKTFFEHMFGIFVN